MATLLLPYKKWPVQECKYVNTDKTNIIYTSIQTQRIKLKEVRLEVLKFVKRDSKQRTKFAKRNFKRHTAV